MTPAALMDWKPRLGGALLVFLLAAVGRLVFIGLYAESVPYWDQWDAEGANLIAPWVEGHMGLRDWLAPHNEHRIVFTRLAALGLFEANQGQWDNLVTANANGLLHAGVLALLFFFLAPPLSAWRRGVFALALVAVAWLPFGHTNALVGFQNQFDFMTVFALAAIMVAARGPDDLRTPGLAIVLALCSLFTMASGLLAAGAAAGVLLLRAWTGSLRPALAVGGTLGLLAVAVSGYMLIPHLPGHAALKATGLAMWWRTFSLNLAWPMWGSRAWGLLVWLPFLAGAIEQLRRRRGDEVALPALGLGAWVLLQCAAIAYSRGAEETIVGRYVDLLAVGVLVNLWFALRLTARTDPRIAKPAAGVVIVAIPVVFAALVFGALSWQAPGHLVEAAQKRAQAQIQAQNVRRFVATGQVQDLWRAFMDVPYPHPARLAQLLSTPSVRDALPASVRAPLRAHASRVDGTVLLRTSPWAYAVSTCARARCEAGMGSWRAEFAPTRFSFVQVSQASPGPMPGRTVQVTSGASPSAPADVDASGLARIVPGVPFSVYAADESPATWMAIDRPVEVGRLSALALRMQHAVRAAFAPGLPAGGRAHPLTLPMGAAASARPWPLGDGQTATGTFPAPRDGYLRALSILIGNYRDTADGDLVLEVCTATTCRQARTGLVGSIDNGHLDFVLDSALPVDNGAPLRFRFTSRGASHPVALWSYDYVDGAPRLEAGPGGPGPRSVLLGLAYLD